MIAPVRLEALEDAPLLAGLPDALIADLTEQAELRNGRRKEIVVSDGAQFPYLGMLLSGMLYVTAPLAAAEGNARWCALFTVHPGETFAEFTVLDGKGTIGEISALTDIHYSLLPKALVEHWMERDFKFARRLMEIAALRSRQTVQRLTGNLAMPIAKRVAAALLPYSADAEELLPSDPALQKLTHIQLAAMVGSVKEVVARTIADFEELGALRREHGHVAYLNRAMLMNLAMETGPTTRSSQPVDRPLS